MHPASRCHRTMSVRGGGRGQAVCTESTETRVGMTGSASGGPNAGVDDSPTAGRDRRRIRGISTVLRWLALPRFVLVVALVAGLLATAMEGRETRAADDDSLTLYTAECSDPLPLDGTPITAETCDTTEDRAFTLVGPAGQEFELLAKLEFVLNGPRVRAARWSVNLQDDRDDEGTYTLTEQNKDPDRQTLYECLLASDGDLVPAELTHIEGGVEFEWTPAVAPPDDVEGQALVCTVYSHPIGRRALPMAGILQIHAGVASLEGGSDLVVRAAGDEPYNLRDSRSADVPSLTYTITDTAGREITLTAPGAEEGPAVNRFPVPPGDYTLTVNATGTSTDVTVEPGQTVLAFNPLDESTAAPTDTPDTQTLDLGEGESTPTPPANDAPEIDAVESFAFTAGDWAGAYPAVNTEVYGRDCVAVYGAGSPHPTGSLTFVLDRVTLGDSQLVLTGLDDELTGGNPIVITVNSQVIFEGASPFYDWDPNNPEIPWNQHVVPFGNDVLVQGVNEIVVANASAGGSIGLPPYILLAEASLFVGLTIDVE